MFGRSQSSGAFGWLRLKAIPPMLSAPLAFAASSASCSGVGSIGCVVRNRGSSSSGSPR